MSKSRWLKKYTKLEYLPEILEKKHLHLGDPKVWDDQNDAEAIHLFSKKQQCFNIRGTCLTAAPDRFHFWYIFAQRELGVCLWFDREHLVRDFDQDPSLISGEVQYRSEKYLRRNSLELANVPFTKREQYRDEKEFRILRLSPSDDGVSEKLKFTASSLQRIYLNPWLSVSSVSLHENLFSQDLTGDLGHVKLEQNRSLRKTGWINALSDSAGTNL